MRKPKPAAKGAQARGSPKRAQSSRTSGHNLLRIVGGIHGGRKLRTTGNPQTRPMKDRVREAVFNLVGPSVRGTHALDLFAGSGALGLEALSRGAARATFFERNFPTAKLIEQNIAALGVAENTEVVAADTFVYFRLHPPPDPRGADALPWLVFSSPPYDFYVQRRDEMLKLLGDLLAAAPSCSTFVVEADQRFDFGQLPQAANWDIRTYLPAVVGVYRTSAEEDA